MLLSQAGIPVVIPLALLGLICLSSRRDLVGEYRPQPVEWVLLSLISAFSLFMSSQAIIGLSRDLAALFQNTPT